MIKPFDLYLWRDRKSDVPDAIAGPYTSEEAARDAYYRYFADTHPVVVFLGRENEYELIEAVE